MRWAWRSRSSSPPLPSCAARESSELGRGLGGRGRDRPESDLVARDRAVVALDVGDPHPHAVQRALLGLTETQAESVDCFDTGLRRRVVTVLEVLVRLQQGAVDGRGDLVATHRDLIEQFARRSAFGHRHITRAEHGVGLALGFAEIVGLESVPSLLKADFGAAHRAHHRVDFAEEDQRVGPDVLRLGVAPDGLEQFACFDHPSGFLERACRREGVAADRRVGGTGARCERCGGQGSGGERGGQSRQGTRGSKDRGSHASLQRIALFGAFESPRTPVDWVQKVRLQHPI
ncbi:MAG: hypothetical protein ACFHWZ_19105 [Phycisphaerales bacterium]